MLVKFSKLLLFAGITAWALSACESAKKFPPEPFLEWREAELRFSGDTAFNRRVYDLTVYFTDGDGDIGREDEPLLTDTCDLTRYERFLDRYDLFIYYYERIEGSYVQRAPRDSCLPFHNILPDLMPPGQNKTLEGEITTPFDFSDFPGRGVDSVKFELQLVDRAGNRSARISSPALPAN